MYIVKVFTSRISSKIYENFTTNSIDVQDQKGCIKKSKDVESSWLLNRCLELIHFLKMYTTDPAIVEILQYLTNENHLHLKHCNIKTESGIIPMKGYSKVIT